MATDKFTSLSSSIGLNNELLSMFWDWIQYIDIMRTQWKVIEKSISMAGYSNNVWSDQSVAESEQQQ